MSVGKNTVGDNSRFLVADIGGTNTRVALTVDGCVDPNTIMRFRSADFMAQGDEAFDHILRDYVAVHRPNVTACCIAIAGPMIGDTIDVTNLGWLVNATKVGEIAGAPKVAFLNDLEALGHSLDHIGDGIETIIAGTGGQARGTRLVVGVGTGFNSAAVYRGSGHVRVAAAEAGHMAFGARTAQELRLYEFAADETGFCAVENVLSGRGLEAVYAWVAQEAGEPVALSAAAITAALARGDDPVAEAAMGYFCRILGGVLSDLSLAYLPFGGVYLAGGVARHLAPYFGRFGLVEAFVDKGRKRELMGVFGVYLIEDDYAALQGCARYLGCSNG